MTRNQSIPSPHREAFPIASQCYFSQCSFWVFHSLYFHWQACMEISHGYTRSTTPRLYIGLCARVRKKNLESQSRVLTATGAGLHIRRPLRLHKARLRWAIGTRTSPCMDSACGTCTGVSGGSIRARGQPPSSQPRDDGRRSRSESSFPRGCLLSSGRASSSQRTQRSYNGGLRRSRWILRSRRE